MNINIAERAILELGIEASGTSEEIAIVKAAVRKAWSAISGFLRYDPALNETTEILPAKDRRLFNASGMWEISGQQAHFRRTGTQASAELQLGRIPVRSEPCVQVWISHDGRFGTKAGAFGSGDLKTEGQDFWPQYTTEDSSGDLICIDGILRSMGRWPSEPGSIKVVYTAGYIDDELMGDDPAIDASAILDVAVEETMRRAKKAFVLWKKNAKTGHNAGTITSENLGDYSYSISGGVMDQLLSSGGLTGEMREKLQPFVHWGLDL